MAIAQTALTSGSSAVDGTSFNTASISPTANRLVVIAVANGTTPAASAAAPSGITGAGLTFTKVAERLDTTNGVALSVWRAMSASPSTGALTIAFSPTTPQCLWSVCEFSGTDTTGTNGSGAIVQSATNIDSTLSQTTLTATLSAFASADNGAYAAHSCVNLTGSFETATPDTGWTEIHDTGVNDTSNVAFSLESQWRATNDTTAAATWTGAGLLAAIAMEIKVPSASSSQAPRSSAFLRQLMNN